MDIEKAREIDSSLNWKEVCSEIDLWIKSAEKSFRICLPADVVKVQATIEVLERVKNLPKVVIDREG